MKGTYFIVLLVLLLGVGVGWWAFSEGGLGGSLSGEGEQTACTLEAKLCPDGSYVGRTGPNCEFAPCPGDQAGENWQIHYDEETGASFQYPLDLGSAYVFASDWPPDVQIEESAFACTEGGEEGARAGRTEEVEIGGRAFCVTKVTEGAAGSVYTQYAYAFPHEGKTAILTFSLRFPQCGNYGDAARETCEEEQEEFDTDEIMGEIMETFELIEGN